MPRAPTRPKSLRTNTFGIRSGRDTLPQNAPSPAFHRAPPDSRHKTPPHHTNTPHIPAVTAIPIEDKHAKMQAACDLIAIGKLVTEAAKTVGINPATLWKWASADPVLGKMYAHAKDAAADALADEALEIARTTTNETYAADRLKVDTLKWAAAKRRPKEYGDRQQVEVSGGIEHLHLDALRSTITAKASIDNALPVAMLRDVSGTDSPATPAAQPIDTEDAP